MPSPAAMPQRKPKHTWRPPFGEPKPLSVVAAKAQADADTNRAKVDNARARRARRNGYQGN